MPDTVDLLDCTVEPTDEQLESLMRAVAASARCRAEAADVRLRRALAEAISATATSAVARSDSKAVPAPS